MHAGRGDVRLSGEGSKQRLASARLGAISQDG